MTYPLEIEIGATAETMENLQDLTVPVVYPKDLFTPWSENIELADGSKRGAGAPMAVWTWATISQAERDQLREFCTGASSTVYIKTSTNDDADTRRIYQATMIWPAGEDIDFTHRRDFTIQFRNLVLQEEA